MTWWDAGEFVTAAHTLGIPHPPGTPLWVLIAASWSRVAGFLAPAFAVNLLSAAATAAAAGLAAAWLARSTGAAAAAFAGALAAGAMSTAWLGATEAEVYPLALLLATLTLLAADRAGRTGDWRWTALTAYAFALAGPLHPTALVAAPAAIVLASRSGGTAWNAWSAWNPGRGALLASVFVASAALATGRWTLAAAGTIAFAAAAVYASGSKPAAALRMGATLLGLVALGATVWAFLLVRAQHDPSLNQGDPSTFAALISMIAREQYAVAPLLPRQAPLWLQFANLFEYVDWQVALGLGPSVTPGPWRTPFSLAFVALGITGAVHHRRLDRRSWEALLVLLLCASAGVVLYLNLKAGPTIGWGILPDNAPHEPRERDYFFLFAFWVWGLWAGIGAAALVRRPIIAIAIAALPIALNARAADRRAEPEASLPRAFAESLLRGAPPNAVLFVGGDNDTYPLWYVQQVLGERPDVTVVTLPLLPAAWYREELHRRYALGDPTPQGRGARWDSTFGSWRGWSVELGAIAADVRSTGRPMVASVTVRASEREHIAIGWVLRGTVYMAGPTGRDDGLPGIDPAAAAAESRRLAPLLSRPVRDSTDPTSRLMAEVLGCAALAASANVPALLDSPCNYR